MPGANVVHAVARLCRTTPAAALAHLSRADGMARWTLGLWNTREQAPGLYTGESLFDGGRGWVRVTVDEPRGAVDYAVGGNADTLVPRIRALVQPGAMLGHDDGNVVITLMAWRTAGMDDERWARLVAMHEVEIDLVRGQLEAAGAAAAGPSPGADR